MHPGKPTRPDLVPAGPECLRGALPARSALGWREAAAERGMVVSTELVPGVDREFFRQGSVRE